MVVALGETREMSDEATARSTIDLPGKQQELIDAIAATGKLPGSFPQRLGQVPIYYNHEPTGRPCDVTQKYPSRYLDLRSCDPLVGFGLGLGFGLNYTSFKVSDLKRSLPAVSRKGSLVASMTVTNTGNVAGDDVAQVYLHNRVASISQPVPRRSRYGAERG